MHLAAKPARLRARLSSNVRPHKVTLVDLWSLWLGGAEVRSEMYLGIQVLWWGRLGKVAQLLAALLGAVEILGARRVARFLAALAGGGYTITERLLHVAFVLMVAALAVGLVLLTPFLAVKALLPEMPRFLFAGHDLVSYAVIGLPMIGLMIFLQLGLYEVERRLIGAVRFVAALSTHSRAHALLKLILLLMFVVGFHFDLLAS